MNWGLFKISSPGTLCAEFNQTGSNDGQCPFPRGDYVNFEPNSSDINSLFIARNLAHGCVVLILVHDSNDIL